MMSDKNVSYQAIILAAGRGSRISPDGDTVPKVLLPIGPRSLSDKTNVSFLQRQCELLADLGVEQTVVVVGYKRELVIEEISRWGASVDIVVNPTDEISVSGSLHSFQFAVRSEYGVLDGQKQTLLMDADIVYDRRALKRFLKEAPRTSLLVCSEYKGDKEEVLVYGSVEQPRFIGKGLHSEVTADQPCIGEATGIVKFAPQDHEVARATIDWLLGDPDAPLHSLEYRGFGPARRSTEHEELSQRFMMYNCMSCVVFGGEFPFMEVDNPEEYAYLREEFYPRILRLEGGEKTARKEERA